MTTQKHHIQSNSIKEQLEILKHLKHNSAVDEKHDSEITILNSKKSNN